MTPEQAVATALADLTQLAETFPVLIARANDAQPGPRASGGRSTGGFDVNDPRYDQPPANDDDRTPMKHDEARALNGPDAAQKDLANAIGAVADLVAAMRRIERSLAPYRPRHRPLDPNDIPDDWCPNHYRQCDRRHAPTKRYQSGKQKGERKWTEGWCSFCGDFLAANGFLPTRKILEARIHGRVTPKLIADEQRRLPKALRPKGDRKRTRHFTKDPAA